SVAERTRNRTLFVVRSQTIDGIGENLTGFDARKLMSGVLGDLRKATLRLARAGFTSFVYVGDHGHVLLPDVDRGEVVQAPKGEWLKEKRRSLVGTRHGAVPNGVHVLSTLKAGVPADAPDFAVPRGFCVFTSGETYFHEGVSLQ